MQSGDLQKIDEAQKHYLEKAKDPISNWLDIKYGSNITDQSIFEALPRYWEDEFHNDMSALNVSPQIKYN